MCLADSHLVPSTVVQVCCGRNHSICLADSKLVPSTMVQVRVAGTIPCA